MIATRTALTIALCATAFALLRPTPARADVTAVEFCPVQVTDFYAMPGTSVYGFQLDAATPRRVTGDLAIDTGNGWFRAPFRPMSLGVVYVRFPKALNVLNAWPLAAASDDPNWSKRGIVSCPPHTRPNAKRMRPLPPPSLSSPVVAAIASKPIASTNCSVPFRDARITDSGNPFVGGGDSVPGYSAIIEIQLDATGKPLALNVVRVSPGDAIEYGRHIVDRLKTMRFEPAIAYCTHVPSSYLFQTAVGGT